MRWKSKKKRNMEGGVVKNERNATEEIKVGGKKGKNQKKETLCNAQTNIMRALRVLAPPSILLVKV